MSGTDVSAVLEARDPTGATGGGDSTELDSDGDLEADPESFREWLQQPATGSVTEVDHREFFSTDQGGLDRLALLGQDLLLEDGPMPRWMHLAVAVLEIAVDQLEWNDDGGDSSSDSSTDADSAPEGAPNDGVSTDELRDKLS